MEYTVVDDQLCKLIHVDGTVDTAPHWNVPKSHPVCIEVKVKQGWPRALVVGIIKGIKWIRTGYQWYEEPFAGLRTVVGETGLYEKLSAAVASLSEALGRDIPLLEEDKDDEETKGSFTVFTFGTEAFINHGQNDVAGIKASQKDTLSADATGISVYVKGQITPKKLGYFARFDSYNPDTHYTQNYTSYLGFSANYEPNNKEKFVTAGLDYTPAKNIHFMPNIWYNGYQAQQSNFSGAANRDHDLVFRITFFYIYDK